MQVKNKSSVLIPSRKNQEIWTDEKCFITEVLNEELLPNISIAIARVLPGITTQLHALAGIEEVYIIRKGFGLAEVDGKQYKMALMDKLTIPADVTQRITNIGSVDLEFYCICYPRFAPENYVNCEK